MTSALHDFAPNGRGTGGMTPLRNHDPLPRLLAQILARAGQPARAERAVSRPWASALFEGRRHVVTLLVQGDDATDRAAACIAGIEQAQWTLTGHFVADICVDESAETPDGVRITLSALTISEW